jgi:hypothetical protein
MCVCDMSMSFSREGPCEVDTIPSEGVDTIPSESRKFFFPGLGHADV